MPTTQHITCPGTQEARKDRKVTFNYRADDTGIVDSVHSSVEALGGDASVARPVAGLGKDRKVTFEHVFKLLTVLAIFINFVINMIQFAPIGLSLKEMKQHLLEDDNFTASIKGGSHINEVSYVVKGEVQCPWKIGQVIPPQIVNLGRLAESPSNSFIEITVYGSHDGESRTTHFEYVRMVLVAGRYVSSNQVVKEQNDLVFLYNSRNATHPVGEYDGIEIGDAFDVQLAVEQVCGGRFYYTVVLRYWNKMSFEPNWAIAERDNE